MELKGIVTKVEWMNPHVYFYLDVKDESGNITNWALEMGPPNGLERSGWTRNTMKVGDEVIVEGTLAKDGAKQANARSVTMAATGKKLGAASSERGPQQSAPIPNPAWRCNDEIFGWLALRAALVLCALALPLVAQDEPPAGLNGGRLDRPRNNQPARPTPHWPDGHVNLGPLPGEKGVWEGNAGSTLATNIARGIDNPRMNLPTNLKISEVPFQPWARALYDYRQATTTKDDPHTKCLPSGGPRLFHTPYGFEFVDVPEEKRVYMIEVGGPHTWRIIHMDGQPHPKNLDPSFFGHSTGRWDGDSLVVDTVGFNERFWLTREGIPQHRISASHRALHPHRLQHAEI